ncbi:hypothetical protein WJX73_006761 [Symbiochloris irregularis]|uniref:Flagellar hook-length control protein FliK n=1 Tax=Symbiochloris irregularis TaxID=706552 RepID=A0AAW1NTT8_9CHLO
MQVASVQLEDGTVATGLFINLLSGNSDMKKLPLLSAQQQPLPTQPAVQPSAQSAAQTMSLLEEISTTLAAIPSDPTLGLSRSASPELKRMVHPSFIEPQELVQLRAQWASPALAGWQPPFQQSFRDKLGGLSAGLSSWEKMEDEQNRHFQATVQAALQQSLQRPAAGVSSALFSEADF